MLDAQISISYESGSTFRDTFSRITDNARSKQSHCHILKAAWMDTPLGPMIAIADDAALHLLEFIDGRGLEREVERLRQRTKSAIIPGNTSAIQSIENE